MSTGLSLENLRNLTISSYTHDGGIKVHSNEDTPQFNADLICAIKAIEAAKNLLEADPPRERQKSDNNDSDAQQYIGVIV